MDSNGLATTANSARPLRVAAGEGPQGAPPELRAREEELRKGQDLLRRKEEQLEKANAELQAQRLRYQELFDFAPNGYVVTDVRGIIQEANHAAASLLRMRKDFLPGKPLPFFVMKGWRADFYARLSRLCLADPTEQWDVCLQPANAEACHVCLTVTGIPGEEGRLAGYRWMLRDVTPRLQAEQALRAEKDFADSLVNTVEAIVLVVGPEGRILRSNSYLHKVSGYDQFELRGADWCDLLQGPADRPTARAMVREVLSAGDRKDRALVLRTKDGRQRTIAWSAKPLSLSDLGPEVVLLGQDITDLQDAQSKALQVERLAAIGQMVAGLAHESRNALQRIQACLSLLALHLQGREEGLDLVGRIQKAQDDLHRLFDEVQEYARPMRLEQRRCDLAQVWAAAWADLSSLRRHRQAELRDERDGVDLRCLASPFHLKQVFRNLLENALSASSGAVEPNLIVMRCREVELDGQPGIEIAICDNGPGFDAEGRQRAFDPFFTTKARGTGLGLAICKRIIEAHGGRIAIAEGGSPGGVVLVSLPRRTP